MFYENAVTFSTLRSSEKDPVYFPAAALDQVCNELTGAGYNLARVSIRTGYCVKENIIKSDYSGRYGAGFMIVLHNTGGTVKCLYYVR